MSYNYTDKLIELLYVFVPIAIILASIILYENSKKKDSKKNEDQK